MLIPARKEQSRRRRASAHRSVLANPAAERAAREVEPHHEARARSDDHQNEGSRGTPEGSEQRHEEQARIPATEHEADRTLGGGWDAKRSDAILRAMESIAPAVAATASGTTALEPHR